MPVRGIGSRSLARKSLRDYDGPGMRVPVFSVPLLAATVAGASPAVYCGCADAAATGTEADAGELQPVVSGAVSIVVNQVAGPPGSIAVPATIAVPFVVAGTGAGRTTITASNPGATDVPEIVWKLEGNSRLRFGSNPPDTLPAGKSGELTIVYEGADIPDLAGAQLTATSPFAAASSRVWAVAGDPKLGESAWEPVTGAGGIACGEGTTVSLPSAPYPHENSPYTNDSVRIFIPDGYRDLEAQDFVVHFHGWTTNVHKTLTENKYQEHLCSSGANAILVLPQGPLNAQSGDFGKLMHPGGLDALLKDVLSVVFREGRIRNPAIGEIVLTSHSGGYQAVAANLSGNPFSVSAALLCDSLYGQESAYEQYVRGGGRLISNYTAGGGTEDKSHALAKKLAASGIEVSSQADQRSLRDSRAVLAFVDTTHEESMRFEGIWGEAVRFAVHRHRRGPRIELRQALAQGGEARLSWLAPRAADLEAIAVEVSEDGKTWKEKTRVAADAQAVAFPFAGGARVRLVPVVTGLSPTATISSDVYRIDAGSTVLVVDGFDRTIGGSFGGLQHDFAATVGEAAGGAQTISHRAVVEDGFDLSPYSVVVWLLGDESSDDVTISIEEQAALTAWLKGGGRLIVSGSEAAYDLDGMGRGAAFVSTVFGATLHEDDARAGQALGTGALAGLGPFVFGGPGRPYEGDSPDSLNPANGGEIVLLYPSGQAAAVGIPGKSALVGFPLELVDQSTLPSLVKGLIEFVR